MSPRRHLTYKCHIQNWKPGYEQKLVDIDNEISILRELIDAVHGDFPGTDSGYADVPGTDSGQGQEEGQDGVPDADSNHMILSDYLRLKFLFFRLHGDHFVFNFMSDENGVSFQEYLFPDGSVWNECILTVLSEEFSLFKILFRNNSHSKCRSCFMRFRGYVAVYQRVKPDEFYSGFRQLCRDYARGFPCENLTFCVRQFEGILTNNRKTIGNGFVMDIFQIMLGEFRVECVSHIREVGTGSTRKVMSGLRPLMYGKTTSAITWRWWKNDITTVF